MTSSCVQSGGTGGRTRAIWSTTRIAYPMKGILKEGTPPNWGRMQGPSTTRLTQLHGMLSNVLGLGGLLPLSVRHHWEPLW
jgi:hypothetical protein